MLVEAKPAVATPTSFFPVPMFLTLRLPHIGQVYLKPLYFSLSALAFARCFSRRSSSGVFTGCPIQKENVSNDKAHAASYHQIKRNDASSIRYENGDHPTNPQNETAAPNIPNNPLEAIFFPIYMATIYGRNVSILHV